MDEGIAIEHDAGSGLIRKKGHWRSSRRIISERQLKTWSNKYFQNFQISPTGWNGLAM